MRSLKQVLVDEFDLDLSAWHLYEATGISADGRTIVGKGYHYGFGTEAWIAHIPEPATLSMLAFAALALGSHRRRRS
jgi:hypothetical protein